MSFSEDLESKVCQTIDDFAKRKIQDSTGRSNLCEFERSIYLPLIRSSAFADDEALSLQDDVDDSEVDHAIPEDALTSLAANLVADNLSGTDGFPNRMKGLLNETFKKLLDESLQGEESTRNKEILEEFISNNSRALHQALKLSLRSELLRVKAVDSKKEGGQTKCEQQRQRLEVAKLRLRELCSDL